MSRDGTIELPWPDQVRTYRLRMGELRQLAEKCGGRGPMEILQALTTGKWQVDDVYQPIRLGLIGGGLQPGEALKVADEYVHDGTLSEAIIFATAVVGAAITGPPDDPIKLPNVTRGGKQTTLKAGSSSARSTAREPASDGRPKKSTG